MKLNELPLIVYKIQIGDLADNRFKERTTCPDCYVKLLNKASGTTFISLIREYDYGTCDYCHRDTQKKYTYIQSMRKKGKRK